VINIFRPASLLMARLTYARKFALIGLVLLIPAVLALHAYWTQQGSQIAFSAKERVGKATGNENLEAEGQADKLEGKGQNLVGKAKNKVEDIKDKVT